MSVVNKKYVEQYSQIHQSKRYGVSGYKFADNLQLCLAELQPMVVLDYGCGQTDLSQCIDFGRVSYHRYDPAIEAISSLPVERADLIVNTDVMEHIPRADLSDVISHMASISGNVFFSIATNEAKEILPDGSNAHCSILTPQEWLEMIGRHFPDVCQIPSKRRDTFLAVTWPSTIIAQHSKLDDLYMIRRRLKKWFLLGLFEKA